MTDSDILKAQAALEAAKAEVAKREAELKEAQKAVKASVIAQIKDLMKQHDLKITDLGKIEDNATKKKRKDAGVKLLAKYKDPVSGKTWTGKGVAPAWIAEAKKNGDMSAYEIKQGSLI